MPTLIDITTHNNKSTYTIMNKLRISKIWIAVIVVAVISIAAWALSGGKEKEEINFKQDQVALKTLQNSVTATGTIEAVTSVTVGTQVSGIVRTLYVDYNTQVKEGTEKLKPTIKLKVDDGDIAVLPFIFCLF